jgi:hypothetical protein
MFSQCILVTWDVYDPIDWKPIQFSGSKYHSIAYKLTRTVKCLHYVAWWYITVGLMYFHWNISLKCTFDNCMVERIIPYHTPIPGNCIAPILGQCGIYASNHSNFISTLAQCILVSWVCHKAIKNRRKSQFGEVELSQVAFFVMSRLQVTFA